MKNIFLIRKFPLLAFVLLCLLFLSIYVHWKIGASMQFYAIVVSLLFGVFALIKKKVDEVTIMGTVLGLVGILYFVICPFECIPDEPNHFKRAFEISMGHLISQHIGENGAGGNILPVAVGDCFNRNAIIDWNNCSEITFPNTSLYAFVSYLPQSIGIWIAQHLTYRVETIYYAGRLCNFLTALVLSIFALCRIPFGKRILFILMLTPMTMQEMISLAPDAMVNSLSFALIAYIFDCAFREKKVSKKDILIIGLMLWIIALCKIVYIVLFLLVYLIPKEKFNEKKTLYSLRVVVPIIAIALNLIWLSISSGFLIEINPGVNSKEQIYFILSNPFKYAIIFFKTMFKHFYIYVRTTFGGKLGLLNISVNPIAWVSFIVVFIYEIKRCKIHNNKINRKIAYILGGIVIFGFSLILTSLYVQWNKVGNDIIHGVQGRYFIPLMPSLSFFFVFLRSSLPKKIELVKEQTRSYLFVLIIFLNLIALVDIIKFYPENYFNKGISIVAQLNEKEWVIESRIRNVKHYSEMKLAVWSEENDQDDIIWFPIGNAEHEKDILFKVPLKEFSTNGNYHLHLWSFDGDLAKDFIVNTQINGIVIKSE